MKKPTVTQPLAEKYRPKSLSDVVGQEHLTAQDNFLRSIIKNNQPVSMILWGPPGSGKTTLARIIGNAANNDFVELSAVTTGLAEVRKVIADAKTRQDQGVQTVLFVDEIHRFNKAQQDAFLPHVESGAIILIGATTENPSFEVIRPLLSRSRVVVLEPLSKENIIEIITRAQKSSGTNKVNLKALDLLAELSGGDARMALNGLEVANTISKGAITTADIKQAMQKMTTKYDKSGEYHFNLISAYIKSMRGSDVEATLYYLARMLDGGEDPKFIARRNIIFASEDIGLSAPAALNLAVSTFLAVERIGLPECNYCLSSALLC